MRLLQRCCAIALLLLSVAAHAGPRWTSKDHYRVLLAVDAKGSKRSNSPAAVDIDFPKLLKGLKAKGAFDESTIEVVAYDSSGKPLVFNRSAHAAVGAKHLHASAVHERSSHSANASPLLPWRIDRLYGINRVTLHFVMPDTKCAAFAVYFDTKESGLGKPRRYPGLVGDGDWFRVGYGRREIGASHFDDFADFDGDGDLDLFKVTVEPFIYCYENVGGNRFVDRGKLTSAGKVFALPHWGNQRSWGVLEFDDWDSDGDQDLFATCSDGPENGEVIVYENTTPKGGPITFTFHGRLVTESGKTLGSGWFPAVTVVDWDGDGNKDILVARDDRVDFFKNTGSDRSVSKIKMADAVKLQLQFDDPQFKAPRADCADIDSDGDLDLFLFTQGGTLWSFENTGTRTNPVLAPARKQADEIGGHSGVKLADFDGDGLIDFVGSCLWEGDPGSDKRNYARLHKNTGTRTAPKFEERTAKGGCPYTEGFQICDMGRQNTVRAVDWDNDGKTDLIGNLGAGAIFLFRNTTDSLFPVFEGEQLLLTKLGNAPRESICDWNSDGRKDLVVTDWKGAAALYLNQGADSQPVFGDPVQLQADGKPIKLGVWPSVLVCDWDLDGKKDLLMGMGGAGSGDPSNWPSRANDGKLREAGFLFYRNIGTDAAPVLARPKWIAAKDGTAIAYVRPNLGSCVDWDGDGKRDFIAAEFENAIRLYRNVGSGKPGDEPVFENVEGLVLVEPASPQMVSGVDALDWNGDGDTDILTGQGHSGTGLRFYEHDYVMDCVNKTFPIVNVGTCEARPQ